MSYLSASLTSFVAFLHVYIFVLEAFLWTTPRGRKVFGLTPSFAEQTKTLAATQGLYNGFLAAGLVWGLLHPVQESGVQIQAFFLGCVAIAGAVGAWTTGKGKIMFIQTVPALVAGGALWVV
jgi:putative membrane protein